MPETDVVVGGSHHHQWTTRSPENNPVGVNNSLALDGTGGGYAPVRYDGGGGLDLKTAGGGVAAVKTEGDGGDERSLMTALLSPAAGAAHGTCGGAPCSGTSAGGGGGGGARREACDSEFLVSFGKSRLSPC